MIEIVEHYDYHPYFNVVIIVNLVLSDLTRVRMVKTQFKTLTYFMIYFDADLIVPFVCFII